MRGILYAFHGFGFTACLGTAIISTMQFDGVETAVNVIGMMLHALCGVATYRLTRQQ